ncbi:RecT-like ssDNA binding protein [Gordonia phage Dolores]|uniref:RecT-like ssDNA binding protein n=2 Tax=Beenievirus TaxID=3044673 RepID=A0A514DIG1_9CAUD|nr:RecT-like ssDNA binding protein [Gordonia phage Sekhmet]YP_010654223.1 RecT-like ssDNA binding protein [Gordonia phage Dolores]QDH93394.1 RecT-like ssDNA binding protein [Gordonia phage Sekhmet]UAJ16487.1 RecT-like ssDNA binding protein [Gordonia phage Dolores]URM87953.1 RecT-like ssDNA binding protein [Gordonia phage WinkNick]
MTSNSAIVLPSTDELSIMPPAQPMQPGSIAQLMQHAQAMDTAHKLADQMCRTPLVPEIYQVGSYPNRDKDDDAVIGAGTAAILYGMELGLNPIQSLQQIFPVHGQPGIYARTAVALLKSRGYKIWTEETSDESVTVIGEAPDGTAEGSTWTIERAEKAGYVPTIDENTGQYRKNQRGRLIGNEKYLTDPQAMLYAKAAMEVCRKLAPEVLMGIGDRDDAALVDDRTDAPRKVRNEAQAPGVDDLRERLGITAAPKTTEPEAPASQAAEQVGESTESETAAPSKDDLKRFTALFARAGITGNSAAAKAKRKRVTEKLIERAVEDDTPLTADECLHVIGQLEALVAQGEADGRGDAALVDTVTALAAEGDSETGGEA